MKTILIIYLVISALTLVVIFGSAKAYLDIFRKEHPGVKFTKTLPSERIMNLVKIIIACCFPIVHIILLFATVFCSDKMKEVAFETARERMIE